MATTILLLKDAEDGMGCTGPIVRVSEANKDKAVEILKEGGYVS